MLLYWPKLLYPYYFTIPTIFPIIFFLSIGWFCGAVIFGLIVCVYITLAQPCTADLFNINNRERAFVDRKSVV